MTHVRRTLLGLALVNLVLWSGCSTPSGDDNPPDNVADSLEEALGVDAADVDQALVAEMEVLFADLDAADADLQAALAETDEETAKQQIADQLASQPNVAWAIVTGQGVSVQYTTGLRAGLIVDPRDEDEEAAAATARPRSAESIALPYAPALAKVPVAPERTALLCPNYWERSYFADALVATANPRFDACGLDRFEVYKDDDCTIQRLLALSNYGVVHIMSHGLPYPSETDVDEVYLLTGHVGTPMSIGLLKLVGWYPDKVTVYQTEFGSLDRREKMLAIAPDVLTTPHALFQNQYNDWSSHDTLVYLGFCFSGAGSWLDEMITGGGALAVVGHDQFVSATRNLEWAESMYNMMGDTTYFTPVELRTWYDLTDTSYTAKQPTADGGTQDVTVNLVHSGSPELVLWEVDSDATFTDPCLEEAVRNRLGITTGALTDADLALLTDLEARNRGIQSLDGLEKCVNLTYLELSSNEISELAPLYGLTQLTHLVLDDNRISDLSPLENLSNLVVLNVGHNYVDSLRGLDNLTSLATLWVNWQRDRDLVSLDGIENLTSLSTLYASGNAIDDLWPLENLTQLWTVSLSYNEIYNLEPLVGLANLKSLHLDENPITDIGPLARSAFVGNNPTIYWACCQLDYNCDPSEGSTTQCGYYEELKAAGANVSWSESDNCGVEPVLSWPDEHEVCD